MYSLLIVEDERRAREALAQLIPWEQLGFFVDGIFQDGTECLEYIQRKTPDVILTDIKMSRTNGIEIAKYVYEHCLRTQVVFMSAYKEFDFAHKAIEYGVSYYLLKPIAVPQLQTTMEKLRVNLQKSKDTKEGIETSALDNEAKTAVRTGSHIEEALAYIEEHYAEEISLERLAEALYLSPSYLSRMLKTQTGKNYTEIVAEKRIEKAVWYLENTGLLVYEIADRVGYHNLKHFYVVFKKVTGKTPYDHRH